MPAVIAMIVITMIVVTTIIATVIIATIVVSSSATVVTCGAVAGGYPAVAERPAYALRMATLAGESRVMLAVTA